MSRLRTSTPQPMPPHMVSHFNAEELVAIAVRLAEILDAESKLLAVMDVRGLAQLHPEKLQLTQMLESYQGLLRAQPDLIEDLSEDMRDKLLQVVLGFSQVMEHNFRQVTAARTVNQTVVRAITDSIAEQQHLTVYNKQGNHFRAGADMSGVSINLNQQA